MTPSFSYSCPTMKLYPLLPVYMNLIHEIDKHAFVVISNVHEVIGEGFKEIE